MSLRFGLLAIIVPFALVVAFPVVGDPIDKCGFIEPILRCYWFTPAEGGEDILVDIPALPDSFKFTPVRVIGEVIPCERDCDGYTVTTCIVDCQLSSCPPVDLGCGILSGPYDECGWLWESPLHGRLQTVSHGYSVGDTVHVAGIVDRRCVAVCWIGDACLWNEVFTDCPDTNSAVESTTWGQIKVLFRR